MATIQNERDRILQATVPRMVPYSIPMDKIDGLVDALDKVRGLTISASANAFTRTGSGATTTPSAITLTAQLLGGLTGAVSWSVQAGAATLTPSGLTCSVAGASVAGYSVTILARVISGGITYDSRYTLSKFGALSAQDTVSLTNQVTGQLAAGNVTGLGALAVLNTVDLNTQTTGALNGQTQVTNLGDLAYANAIAANQIGAGTLAAGVIYAGSINADNITSGSVRGRTISTLPSGYSGSEIVLKAYGAADGHTLLFYDSAGLESHRLTAGVALFKTNSAGETPLQVQKSTNGGYCAAFASTSRVITVHIGAATGIPLRLQPQAAFPPSGLAVNGCMFNHQTHGFCVHDGSNWLKVQIDPNPVT